MTQQTVKPPEGSRPIHASTAAHIDAENAAASRLEKQGVFSGNDSAITVRQMGGAAVGAPGALERRYEAIRTEASPGPGLPPHHRQDPVVAMTLPYANPQVAMENAANRYNQSS